MPPLVVYKIPLALSNRNWPSPSIRNPAISRQGTNAPDTYTRSKLFRPSSRRSGSFLIKSAFIGWSWHLMISIAAQLTHSWSRSRRAARRIAMFHGFGVHVRTYPLASWHYSRRGSLEKAPLNRPRANFPRSRNWQDCPARIRVPRQQKFSVGSTTSTKALEVKSRTHRRWRCLRPGEQEIEKLPKDADRLHKVANRMFASALELMLRD